MDEIIEIASTTSSSSYSSERSKNSDSSLDWSYSDYLNPHDHREMNADQVEIAKMNRKIDRLVVQLQNVCNDFVSDTTDSVEIMKDLTSESISYRRPGHTIADTIERQEKHFLFHTCKFVTSSTCAIKKVTHAVLNRKARNTVTERMISGETWT